MYKLMSQHFLPNEIQGQPVACKTRVHLPLAMDFRKKADWWQVPDHVRRRSLGLSHHACDSIQWRNFESYSHSFLLNIPRLASVEIQVDGHLPRETLSALTMMKVPP